MWFPSINLVYKMLAGTQKISWVYEFPLDSQKVSLEGLEALLQQCQRLGGLSNQQNRNLELGQPMVDRT
jgi:hypothetical protein